MNLPAMRAEFRDSLPEILEGRDPMGVPDGRIRCVQCRMTFRTEAPGRNISPYYPDYEICGELGCKRRIWIANKYTDGRPSGARHCIVGVLPNGADRPIPIPAERPASEIEADIHAGKMLANCNGVTRK